MSWIKSIAPAEAKGLLKEIYNRVLKTEKEIPNLLRAQSLRPITLDAALSLDKSLLGSPGNKFPAWFSEAVGVYVSYLNGCEYCVEHHYNKMKDLIGDNRRAENIRVALAENAPARVFDVWEEAIMKFAQSLTINPAAINNESLEELRLCGLEDDEILEVVQAVSYFSYINRIALGLGVKVEDSLMSLSQK